MKLNYNGHFIGLAFVISAFWRFTTVFRDLNIRSIAIFGGIMALDSVLPLYAPVWYFIIRRTSIGRMPFIIGGTAAAVVCMV